MSEENALPGQEVKLTAMPTVDDVIEAMKDVIDPEPVSYTHLTLPTNREV